MEEQLKQITALRYVPYMGVIWVVHEASKLGFWNGHPDWCNLGQGQPEVGELAGAPQRLAELHAKPEDHAYGPIGGTEEVREAIARHYNRLFRRGKLSQYTSDNVSFADGGRLMLTRLFLALGDVKLAYKTPDYTAYEDFLNYVGHHVDLVQLAAKEEDGFSIPAATLEQAVAEDGVQAYIFSNPCNPTGDVVRDQELAGYVETARQHDCFLGCDEFYSHFIYNQDGSPDDGPVSAAAFVQDVDADPVVVVDGLTKSFRYPGWRAGWALGPKHMIEIINRVGSAIDGGPSRLVQRMTLAALEPQQADQENHALRQAFSRKRNLMVRRLNEMGIHCAADPRGTFYAWASIADLPPAIRDADDFFHACLAKKVMTVPGRFFDVNPAGARKGPSPFSSWVRFSFGPPEDVVATGLDRIQEVISQAG